MEVGGTVITRVVHVILAMALIPAAGAVGAASDKQDQSPRAAAHVALRTGGLRAAAAASGGEFATTTEWIGEVAYTLESLVHSSEVVLVGELIQNRAHLSASGEYITTDYRMRVQRSVKGGVKPQSEVIFQVMGGTVVFEDGSSAVIRTPGFVKPNTGARVVIFARRFPDNDPLMPPAVRSYANGAPVFRLVGMGRGVIELPGNETERIRMNAMGARDQAAQKIRGLQVGQLLAELERVVRRFPKSHDLTAVGPAGYY